MIDKDINQYFSYYRIKEKFKRKENKNKESLILLTM